ncbi:zinc-containing alcohol dehydrogenase [Sparganum proliferum]
MGRGGRQRNSSKSGCCLKFWVTVLALTVVVLLGVIIWLIYRTPPTENGSASVPQPDTAARFAGMDVCKLPQDVGPCRAMIKRFAYDDTAKACVPFTYGGCQGNGNNFETKEECEEKCMETAARFAGMDVCKLPQEVGPCRAMIKRFAYDDTAKACVPFTYGGCQGNGNNFETKEECEEKCMAPIDDPCKQPIKVGPCLALIPRFGFDQTIGQCVQFMYGGCEPNENNFDTLDACQQRCPDVGEAETDVCKLPQDVGPCRAMIKRFAYDDTAKACVPFTYGGCQGNGNNFETKEECEEKCMETAARFAGMDVCKLPQEVGPCRAMIKRFAYDDTAKACVPFTYGGCQGNGNNFETKEECEEKCMEALDDPCKQPIEVGPCFALIPRFAFNKTVGKCVHFNYGGCQGNQNNFESLEACQQMCPASADQLDVPARALPERCTLPVTKGPCNMHWRRYAYNPQDNICRLFIYGGCQGNENNFMTREECERECKLPS